VRTALDRPDSITSSAITAREEIGIAIASKIKEFESATDLRRAVYELLPAIERFLESPEEKRLHGEERRLQQIRAGVLTSAAGLTITLLFLLFWSYKARMIPEDIVVLLTLAGLGVLLIGLGIVLNGLFFTTLKKPVGDPALRARRLSTSDVATNDVAERSSASTQPSGLPSITEGTTRELNNLAK
jgi:hypothetical protein